MKKALALIMVAVFGTAVMFAQDVKKDAKQTTTEKKDVKTTTTTTTTTVTQKVARKGAKTVVPPSYFNEIPSPKSRDEGFRTVSETTTTTTTTEETYVDILALLKEIEQPKPLELNKNEIVEPVINNVINLKTA